MNKKFLRTFIILLILIVGFGFNIYSKKMTENKIKAKLEKNLEDTKKYGEINF